MAMTKPQLITAVRRLTRLNSTVPYSDDQITQFINEAIQEVSTLCPFDIKYEEINTTFSNVYTISDNLLDFFGVFYYPLAGDKLASGIDGSATTIPLQDASSFPSNGYAVIGNMENWEIVRYTGKNANSLTGVTRGVYGTSKTWASGTAVHLWKSGEWWYRLEIVPANAMFDFGVPDDNTRPTKVLRQGKTIILNRNPVKGYGNLFVTGFTTPPPLVDSTDTIRNLENREMVVVYLASIKVLASLGSEEALVRVQYYMPLFQLELQIMQQQIDKQVRGLLPQSILNMFNNNNTEK
jgi:hypothetical protein